MKRVHVIIAVYNRKEFTRKCLHCLQSQSYPLVTVHVVDDGSTDGTVEMLRSDFPRVNIVRTCGNLYWTGSMNAGVSEVMSSCNEDDFILVLNNDLLLGPSFIESLVQSSKLHPSALIHACNTYDDRPEIIEFGGVRINWWTAKSRWVNKGLSISQFASGYHEVTDAVWGRGLLIPCGLLSRIGNYDSRYQQNGDTEFGRRAVRTGCDLLVSYDAVALMYRKGENSAVFDSDRYRISDLHRYFFGVHSGARVKTLLLDARLLTNSPFQSCVFGCMRFLRFAWHFVSHLRMTGKGSTRGSERHRRP